MAAGIAAGALALVACSPSDPAPDPTGDDTGAGVLTIASIPNYQDSLPVVVEAFKDKYPDIDVQLEFVDVAALHTQIRTQLSAGTAPDIFTAYPGNGTPTAMENLVPGGYLADMSDLGFSSKLPSGMESTTSIDGKRYILPLSLGGIGGIYNVTALEETGLDIPDTWSGVLQFCADAAAQGRSAYAYGAQTGWINQFPSFPLSATLVYGADPTFTERQNAGEATFSDSPGWRSSTRSSRCSKPTASSPSRSEPPMRTRFSSSRRERRYR
ncbi:extracellular solute-binding protein [Microbacterium sp. NIBRBAC000506063]|nr:extracellular solute-binding protein [Microbacterium sp. NIBRBAC000506063]QTV79328.1 extracellular solute-binding protein [Microbacterium sp. NIBRBAC000506063]